MNISLDDYQTFAKSLNLSPHKKFNGEFVYVDNDTGDVIHPYLLGKFYRLSKKENISLLTQEIDSLEYHIFQEKHKLKELPSVVKEQLQLERNFIETLKKEIE